jgi:endonuclease YncB( thermonuclease family)
VAIGITRTLTENGDSGGYRTLAVAAGATRIEYLGKVIEIADGDTFALLVCREQLPIHLAEIDTPEKGQPYGRRARQALSALIYGKTVRVVEIARDRYGRVVGRVYVGNVDVNAEMVRRGAAWVDRKYAKDPSLYELEKEARRRQTRNLGAARGGARATLAVARGAPRIALLSGAVDGRATRPRHRQPAEPHIPATGLPGLRESLA